MKMLNKWTPNRSLKIALYKQLYLHLKKLIVSGDIPLGFVFPSLRKLENVFGVNKNIISGAFYLLANEELIETSERKRFRVTDMAASGKYTIPNWPVYIGRAHQKSFYNSAINYLSGLDDNTYSKSVIGREFSPYLPVKLALDKVSSRMEGNAIPLIELGGTEALRTAVCEYLAERGIMAKTEQIIAGVDSYTMGQLISNGLCGHNTNILICSDAWLYSSTQVFQSVGSNIHYLPSDYEGVRVDCLTSRIKSLTNVIVYISPLFASLNGFYTSEKRMREVYKICRKANVPIIEHDMMGDYWHEPKPPRPMKSYDDSGLILYLTAIGNILFPRGHLAAAVASEYVINRLRNTGTSLANSAVQSSMFESMLSDGYWEEFLSRIRPGLLERLNFIEELTEKYLNGKVSWIKPRAGFMVDLVFNGNIRLEKINLNINSCMYSLGLLYNSKYHNHLQIYYMSCPKAELEEFMGNLSIQLS